MSDDLRGVIARGLARRRYDHCGGPDGTSLTGKPNWLLCLPDADRALDAIRDAGWTLEPPPSGIPLSGEQAVRLWNAIKATAPTPETD